MILTRQQLFGLLELDPEGTVLFSRLEGDNDFSDSAANLAGLNYFSEVASFQNVKEFQQQFDAFQQLSL